MSLLDLLGYVGDALAKPGRAVRGGLAGRPDELLSALPFSDSLGLTDPTRAVSGRGLLGALGVDLDDSFGSDAAGFGAELATDPLTYVGGALARRLFGGAGAAGLAGKAAEEPGTFRLVSPMDEAIDSLQSARVPGEPPRFTVQPAVVPDAAPAAPMSAGPGLIDELPPFDSFAPALNYSAPRELDWLEKLRKDELVKGLPPTDRAYAPGVADDLAREGDRLGALKLAAGNWSGVADETLSRLSPAALLALKGDGGATAGSHAWQGAMHAWLGDLSALRQLGDAGAVPEYNVLRPLIEEQFAKLGPYSTYSAEGAGPVAAARDLLTGGIRPGQVGERLLADVGHLPLADEAALRRLAALRQRSAMTRILEGHLRDPFGELLGPEGRALHPIDDDPARLASSLGEMLDPHAIANEFGIEPNIARLALEQPHPEQADLIAHARELLARLTRPRPA